MAEGADVLLPACVAVTLQLATRDANCYSMDVLGFEPELSWSCWLKVSVVGNAGCVRVDCTRKLAEDLSQCVEKPV